MGKLETTEGRQPSLPSPCSSAPHGHRHRHQHQHLEKQEEPHRHPQLPQQVTLFMTWTQIILAKNALQVAYTYVFPYTALDLSYDVYKTTYNHHHHNYNNNNNSPCGGMSGDLITAFVTQILVPSLIQWDFFFAFAFFVVAVGYGYYTYHHHHQHHQHHQQQQQYRYRYRYRHYLCMSAVVFASLLVVDLSFAWVFWALGRLCVA